MAKRNAASDAKLVESLREMIGQLTDLKFALTDSLSRANKHIARLSFNAQPDTDGGRFMAWCAAELDKRNTGKPDIPGIPTVIRAAHIKDLEAWVSETLRRAEAARAVAFATCFDGDHSRNVGVRWPALNRDDD